MKTSLYTHISSLHSDPLCSKDLLIDKEIYANYDNSSIESILESYITKQIDDDIPFMLVNLASVVDKCNQWKELLPRVEPHYAVKCNSDSVILAILALCGVKFDCASQGEIASVLKIPDVSPSDIIFANPCKPRAHIAYARKYGVNQMTFDNEIELRKIQEIHPEAELFLRIAVDDSAALCQLSSKFGAKLNNCTQLLKEGMEMGLNIVGVSFHVGSGQQTVDAYIDALTQAKKIFDIAENLGSPMRVLDIGGGFPGDEDEDSFFGFEIVANAIRKKLDELFPNIRIISEPGRFFVAASCTLATKVIAVRDQSSSDSDEVDYLYYINDGVYGCFNNILYDHAVVVPKLLKQSDNLVKCTIFGPSCDGLDCILKNYPLPRLQEGEWIYWSNMGAYTICAAASFNGFPLPDVYYIWKY